MENRTDALIAELDAFMAEYDKRTNAHDVSHWGQLVAGDATYWFTDGSFEGIDAIADAVQRTFDEIQDEVYTISDCIGSLLQLIAPSCDTTSIGWATSTARDAKASVGARTQ